MCCEKQTLKQACVNTAGLRLPTLRKTYLQGWPLAGKGSLCWHKTFPKCWDCLHGPTLCVQSGLCWTATSFWESGILVCAQQRVPTWPAPMKTLGAEPLMSFSGSQHSACVVTTLVGGIKCVLWDSTERGLGKPPLVPSDCPVCLFSLLILLFTLSLQ